MPVRVDGATATSPAGTPPRSGGGGRGLLVAVAVAVVVAVVIGIVVGALVVRSGGSPTPQADPLPPGNSAAVPSSQAPRVVEALPRSEIVAGDGGISNVFELRTGYGKTTNEAVQAAMNFFIVDNGPAYYNQQHYLAIQDYMFASPQVRAKIGFRQAAVDAMRKQNGVNDQGQPLTNGQPDPNKRIWDAVYPQYGAYRIVETSADEVRVMIWAPAVFGVDAKDATSTARLRITWLYSDQTVRWSDGDWRAVGNKAYAPSEVPKPADPAQIVTSYAERADLLGTNMGWTLPANAVETDTPELQLPGK